MSKLKVGYFAVEGLKDGPDMVYYRMPSGQHKFILKCASDQDASWIARALNDTADAERKYQESQS